MISLQIDPALQEGDLVYKDGQLSRDDYDLETAILLSLFLDAPAGKGDVPDGIDLGGWCLGQYLEDLVTPLGSRLWTLSHGLATTNQVGRAEAMTKDALQWLITDKHVKALDAFGELVDGRINIAVNATKFSGETVRIGPFSVGSN
jgi:phage gp46-like protein